MKTTALILASTVVAASAFSPSPMKMAAVSELNLKDRGPDWIFCERTLSQKRSRHVGCEEERGRLELSTLPILYSGTIGSNV